ncbi:multicopper oxidase domain-containing protein, partial [Aeromicrobium sp.]|uniref:multicopper oxidase domain-containing protein n=1 Tax=Aeromicrobium sp. TaxID=1871063 RepID=UPI0028ACAB09
GLLGYAAGIALLARPFLAVARRKPPVHFPTWSVMAGVAWFACLVVACAAMVATAPDPAVAHDRISTLTPALAVGFVAQVLLGALSYLVPVNVGHSPAGTRAANTVLDRGAALRVAAANAGMVVFMLPVPSWVSVLVSLVVVVALASFVPLLFLARRAARRARTERAVGPRPTGPAAVAGDRPAGQRMGQAVAGFIVVVLAVAVGVAVDPAAVGRSTTASADAGVAATGHTTTVEVEARDMRFHPSSIDVPAGDRLVIELTNSDDVEVHDLVLDSGHDSGRLRPGESATMDVGIVGRDLGGWCSIVGHRQMGMVLDVNVTGATAPAVDHADMDHGDGGGAMPPVDLMADPGPGFTPYDATLPAPPDGTVHRRTLTVTEQEQEVAPGVTQRRWTFNGSAPGPTLHGKVGDVFEITLVNEGSMGHSIDFHAGERAPDEVMRTIPPGESLVYRFRAARAGIWMYHCSTMPMSAHIANGMFGAVVIEPANLPEVDRSYVLVQSEVYLGGQGEPVDVDKVQAERPDLVVFNGYPHQYAHERLEAKVGERVRVWVLDAGPNRASSFHVVGEQFDTVWTEGAYSLRRGTGGAQVLPLLPAQGGFVELTFDEPGNYPFVSHVMVDAERGAQGAFAVEP